MQDGTRTVSYVYKSRLPSRSATSYRMMPKRRKKPTGVASGYAILFPSLVKVARRYGYALGLHGSMQRDLDLIAVPWVARAARPETLIEAIRDHVGGILSPHDNNGSLTEKPHGRRCWTIHFGGPQYLDISVLPRQQEIPAIAKALSPLH